MDRALLTHRSFPLTVNPTGVMDFLLWFETVSILTPAKYFLQYFLLVLYSFGGLKDRGAVPGPALNPHSYPLHGEIIPGGISVGSALSRQKIPNALQGDLRKPSGGTWCDHGCSALLRSCSAPARVPWSVCVPCMSHPAGRRQLGGWSSQSSLKALCPGSP